MSNLNITIENKAGTYKSFYTEGDPVWDKYPLKGATYPVDYGCIEGYTGEDEAELDEKEEAFGETEDDEVFFREK